MLELQQIQKTFKQILDQMYPYDTCPKSFKTFEYATTAATRAERHGLDLASDMMVRTSDLVL